MVGAQETWQVYGFEGQLVAEYNLAAAFNGTNFPAAATPTKEYGYRNGQMLVAWDGTETDVNQKFKWLVADHLGSTRMEVGGNGAMATMRRHDYAPFGEEMQGGQRTTTGFGYTTAGVREKFGTYERDNETGLDFAQARYYASVQGRFTSVDPLLQNNKLTYPQGWNRYSYCINNPLRFIDPTGLDWYKHDETDDVQWYEKGKQPKGYSAFNPPGNHYSNYSLGKTIILNPSGPDRTAPVGSDAYQGWTTAPLIAEGNSEMAAAVNFDPFVSDPMNGPQFDNGAAGDMQRALYSAVSDAFGTTSNNLGIGPLTIGTLQSPSNNYAQFGIGKTSPLFSLSRTSSRGEPSPGVFFQMGFCTIPCWSYSFDLLRFKPAIEVGVGSPTAGVGVNFILPGERHGDFRSKVGGMIDIGGGTYVVEQR